MSKLEWECRRCDTSSWPVHGIILRSVKFLPQVLLYGSLQQICRENSVTGQAPDF